MASVRKKRNAYEIRVSCGYDASGKQIFKQMTWHPVEGMTPKQIEKEVTRQAVLFEEECKNTPANVPVYVTFKEFCELWFKEYARLNLKSTSYERMTKLKDRVYGGIGHIRLDKLTVRDIQQFINDLIINGKNQRNGEPLARKTVVHHYSLISSVLNYAVRMEVIDSNPFSKVIIPKGSKKDKNIYSVAELEEISKLLKNEPLKYRVFFTMVLYTGFRRGEMLGLEWKDIDFENQIISVRRTSNYTAEKGIYTDTTKTVKSRRSGHYPKSLFDLLKVYKAEQEKNRENAGSKWIDSDRLFVQWNGQPMNNGTPYQWFHRFCNRNNLRFCDIHSFRHAHASILINAGVDIATVSADLGHSNSATTLGIYTHEFQDYQIRTSNIIEKAINF